MDHVVITRNGQQLLSQLAVGEKTAVFTRVCTSSEEYTENELEALTELKDICQQAEITNVEVKSGAEIVISSAIDNRGLDNGYHLTAMGIYAKAPDEEEILYAVSLVGSKPFLPEQSETLTGISVRFTLKVGNSASITINVDETTSVTVGEFNVFKQEIREGYRKLEAQKVDLSVYDNAIADLRAKDSELNGNLNNLINIFYPVGTIYTSTRNISPETLLGGTWTPIKDTFLLCAGDTYKAGSTGGDASVTLDTANLPVHVHGLNNHTHSVPEHAHGLNNHTHSVPAHAHGLNNHTHSIPALSGTAANAGNHTHTVTTTASSTSEAGAHTHSYTVPNTNTSNYVAVTSSGTYKRTSAEGNESRRSDAAGAHTHSIPVLSGSAASNGAHTHTVTTIASTSGAASGNTANSSALTSGQASGSTANSLALTSSQASGNTGSTGSGTAFSILPPYKTVYAWERTA